MGWNDPVLAYGLVGQRMMTPNFATKYFRGPYNLAERLNLFRKVELEKREIVAPL